MFFLPRFWDMIFWSIGENYAEPNLRHFEEFRCLENNNACMQYSFWMWMFDDILAEGRIVSIKMIRSRNCGTTQSIPLFSLMQPFSCLFFLNPRQCLLTLLDSPLNRAGLLQVFIKTRSGVSPISAPPLSALRRIFLPQTAVLKLTWVLFSFSLYEKGAFHPPGSNRKRRVCD